MTDAAVAPADVRARVRDLLAAHDPASTPPVEFLRARFDAGLAWVHYPAGLGGLGAPRALQAVVDAELAAAHAPDNDPRRIGIGLGMAAPTILAFGTPEQQRRWLRPLFTGEEVWCQLFSEPGAGSDLAGLATRAVLQPDGETWIVDGQKVWTSNAHAARWALLLARHDPAVVKHAGLTYFVLDMTDPGVEVRPLRQITGEAEFNEVWLNGVRIPDAHRLGPVGAGWKVAQATLMNERIAIGGSAAPRESGMIGGSAGPRRGRARARAARAPPPPAPPLAGAARAADARAPRPAARALDGRRGQPHHRAAAAAAARRGPAGARGVREQAGVRPALPGDQQPGGRAARRGGPGLRRLVARPPRPRRLHGRDHRPRRRLPVPAREGQLDRGRDLGDPPERGRRARARPARRTPHRHHCAVEGPAAMTTHPDLAEALDPA